MKLEHRSAAKLEFYNQLLDQVETLQNLNEYITSFAQKGAGEMETVMNSYIHEGFLGA